MDEAHWQQVLELEGYHSITSHREDPGVYHPPHTHAHHTVHVILAGSMELQSDGQHVSLRLGDRYDVPPERIHSVRIGPGGCTYLVGNK